MCLGEVYSVITFFGAKFDPSGLKYLLFMTSNVSIQQQIKEVVKSTDISATTILYGSRARGKARKDSDWDILILLNKTKVTLKDEQKFRHKLYELELKIGQPISTFVYSSRDWNTRMSDTPLFKNIQLEGKIL